MDETLKRKMLARMAHEPSPLERVQWLLQYLVASGDAAELERQVTLIHGVNPHKIEEAIAALDTIAAGAHPPGFLRDLVLHDANRRLDDPSDAAARAWLTELAETLRGWTGGD